VQRVPSVARQFTKLGSLVSEQRRLTRRCARRRLVRRAFAEPVAALAECVNLDGHERAVMPTKLTNEIITAAIQGFETQKARIDQQVAELRAILSGGPAETAATPEAPTRKRKRFSAAARRKMAMAQKARWAKIKGESEPPAPATPKPSKPKRKLSRAGRAAIIAATKARWDRVRAEAAKATKTAAKKPAKKAAPKRKLSPAAKAKLVANLAKARAAKAAKANAA